MPRHVRILFCTALLIALVTVIACTTGVVVEAARHPEAELPGLELVAAAGCVLTFTFGLGVLAGVVWFVEWLDQRRP